MKNALYTKLVQAKLIRKKSLFQYIYFSETNKCKKINITYIRNSRIPNITFDPVLDFFLKTSDGLVVGPLQPLGLDDASFWVSVGGSDTRPQERV